MATGVIEQSENTAELLRYLVCKTFEEENIWDESQGTIYG